MYAGTIDLINCLSSAPINSMLGTPHKPRIMAVFGPNDNKTDHLSFTDGNVPLFLGHPVNLLYSEFRRRHKHFFGVFTVSSLHM
jgi:hypothetical protein